MSSLRPRILFVYQHPSPFILQDRDLLGRHAVVHEFRYSGREHPARALSRWMVGHRRDYDLVFIWFGDVHASVGTRVAKLLGKPSVVVIGGYDVSDLRGYGYLSTERGLRRARGHFARATRVLAVSAALRDAIRTKFPEVEDKTEVLPTGVDTDRFRPQGNSSPIVLSVAGASDWMRAWIKGWDRVVEVARLLPQVPFRLVGAASDVTRKLEAPKNVKVMPPVPHAELPPQYQRARVYLQASRSEGFPNTVLEAMACGCIPVVTAVGGMPELVGDAGIVVGAAIEEIAAGIERALASTQLAGRARERVATHFSLKRREEGLARLLDEVL